MKFNISKQADFNAKDHPAAHPGSQIAGEALDPCTPVKLADDGKGNVRVFAAVAGDVVSGISEPRAVVKGQPVGVWGPYMRFHARSEGDLVPGLYGLTANKGEVDSAATTPVFEAVSKTDLRVIFLGKTQA